MKKSLPVCFVLPRSRIQYVEVGIVRLVDLVEGYVETVLKYISECISSSNEKMKVNGEKKGGRIQTRRPSLLVVRFEDF